MTKHSSINTFIAVTLIILGVTLRVIPHPDNFAPVAAIAIFGGAILPRRFALTIPLLAMVLSDAIIGFHSLILVTWGCYVLIALASHLWLSKPNLFRGVTVMLSGSLFFFVVTNFAVWLSGNMYAHNLGGLLRCFTLALPFFRNTLMSDFIYTISLFGLYALALRLSAHKMSEITIPKDN